MTIHHLYKARVQRIWSNKIIFEQKPITYNKFQTLLLKKHADTPDTKQNIKTRSRVQEVPASGTVLRFKQAVLWRLHITLVSMSPRLYWESDSHKARSATSRARNQSCGEENPRSLCEICCELQKLNSLVSCWIEIDGERPFRRRYCTRDNFFHRNVELENRNISTCGKPSITSYECLERIWKSM